MLSPKMAGNNAPLRSEMEILEAELSNLRVDPAKPSKRQYYLNEKDKVSYV